MKYVTSTASFTRPTDTTPYADKDLVANSTTAGSVSPMSFYIPYGRGVEIVRANITRTTNATVTGATFRIHLFKDSPTVTGGDNAGLAVTTNGASYIGFIAVDQSAVDAAIAGVGVGGTQPSTSLTFVTDIDQVVYGLIEAKGAYVPTNAEVISVTLTAKTYL